MTQAAILAASGSPGTTTGFKNKIINGNMVIDQRNAGASVTPAATTYSLDRWNAFVADGGSGIRYSFQQVSTAPTGFSNSIKITTTTSGTSNASDRYFLQQSVEGFNFADCGWGTANAKTVTLSFWVYSSLTGTFGGALGNESQDRSYPFTYTISSANTWTFASVTIAGDTTGTWTGATNGTGVKLYLNIATGSTRTGTAGAWAATYYTNATGSVNLGQTSGATLYWTGVQLEVGTTATNFDFRSIGTEALLCQRYFYQINAVASDGTMGVGVLSGGGAANRIYCGRHPVSMRTTPSLGYNLASSVIYDGSSTYSFSGLTVDACTSYTACLGASGVSGGVTGRPGIFLLGGSTAYINFNAEL